ncbi:MAG: hypothetical protein ACK5YE_05315, partial [Planctomyces sp.]
GWSDKSAWEVVPLRGRGEDWSCQLVSLAASREGLSAACLQRTCRCCSFSCCRGFAWTSGI